MLRNIQLLIFDIDGTLVNSTDVIWNAFNTVLQTHGCEVVNKEFVSLHMGMPLREMFRELFLEHANEEFFTTLVEEYVQVYTKIKIQHTTLQPYVREILEYFAQKKKLAIATTAYTSAAQYLLNEFHLRHYFDVVYGADKVTHAKPDPEIIQKILNECSVTSKQAVMIGDMTLDVLAGKAAGTHTIAVTTGTHSRAILEQAQPEYIIDSLKEITHIITE
ncbi:MAG TPA: HAD family hydrolase [Patescibacteria group bacterium]|nr:HAD family hydrolase [Patescibacteria group bacterium]